VSEVRSFFTFFGGFALNKLTSIVSFLPGACNIGIVQDGNSCLLIDAGSDGDAARRIQYQLRAVGLEISAVLITHSHADHTGGAAYFHNEGAEIWASAITGAFLSDPILEPQFLSCGAEPIPDLHHKFFLAASCPEWIKVEPGELLWRDIPIELISLEGHTDGQLGIVVDGVAFVGDSLTYPGFFKKYPIPYCTHIQKYRYSMERIDRMNAQTIILGHGPIVHPGTELGEFIKANEEVYNRLEDKAFDILTKPTSIEDLIAPLAAMMDLKLTTVIQWFLTRTTVHAIISDLYRKNLIQYEFIEDHFLWKHR
jgi:glyoxylase-like metal-dependent hydrolase (beta-lactamase superfamily II)